MGWSRHKQHKDEGVEILQQSSTPKTIRSIFPRVAQVMPSVRKAEEAAPRTVSAPAPTLGNETMYRARRAHRLVPELPAITPADYF